MLAILLAVFFQQPARAALSPATYPSKSKLVLVIVVDQFRADYLTRFKSRFLPETAHGYRYLISRGAYFPFAEYQTLQDMTAPGHSMILSGSYPYRTGIPINYWMENGAGMYCVSDSAQAIVGANPKSGGMSPKNFLGTTFGDELKNAGMPSKVITVSLKDRAAILLGGKRADLAIWFDPESFKFVTSQYYAKQLPAYVESVNAEIAKKLGSEYRWSFSGLGKSSGKATGLSVEKSFDHSFKYGSHEAIETPLGLSLNTQMAEKAFLDSKIGTGSSTDVFAVSFSAHDYAGHRYGPNALEMEEMALAEDREIGHLISTVLKRVPEKDLEIVFTADHGMAPNPEYMKNAGLDAGKTLYKPLTEFLQKELEEKFGAGKWVLQASDLNVYLNHDLAREKKVAIADLQNAARASAIRMGHFAGAITTTEMDSKMVPPGIFERQSQKSYFPGRSGDLILIPKPFHMVAEENVTHQTGYSYDRMVPVIFVGAHFKSGVYPSQADVVDIAPTLSWLHGVVAPVLSEGRVLAEILK